MYGDMILAENAYLKSGFKKNMNCLVLGVPGSGKTRGHILPNLCNMENSSAVLLDPKGELYSLTANMMRKRGFAVKLVDFENPNNSQTDFYNPLEYCKTTEDVLSITKLLVAEHSEKSTDLFWPSCSQLLANALIGYLIEETHPSEITFPNVMKLLKAFKINDNPQQKSPLDILFDDLKKKTPNSWAVEQYNLLQTVSGSEKTYACIVASLLSTFANTMTDGTKKLMSRDTLDISSIGNKKTVVYIKSSDSDRSKDKFISVLFQQIFKELFSVADNSKNNCLNVHTHLFLDDIGTNLTIERLDCYLAACRSREISCSVILQSIGQLKKQYGEAYTAILGSCASLVFLGSNDINTCYEMSLRLNKPLNTVLYKNTKDVYVFTQGEQPVKSEVYNIKAHPNYRMINDFKEKSYCSEI